MKAYLFFETGEVRKPKKGEWYRDDDGDNGAYSSNIDFQHAMAPILTRHEIEIPEGATLFQYQANKGELYHFYREEGICSYGHFPIPRPKRKVKKTVYLHVQNHNGRAVYSVHDGNTAPSEAYPVEIEVEE